MLLILFALFVVWPALVGLYLSFTEYRLLKPPEWIGIDHNAKLLQDPDVHQAAGNTAILFAEVVPVTIVLRVRDFPVIVGIDCTGRDIYDEGPRQYTNQSVGRDVT